MKILHTSDWHLGLGLHNVSLLEEQAAMVDCLLATVAREQVEAVVLAGDVFDHAVASAEAISLYNHAMTSLCGRLGVPVVLCAGNHDGAARLASCGELLGKAGLFVRGKISAAMVPVVVGDAAFHLLPYFHADEARCLFPDEELPTAGHAMDRMCSLAREHLVPGKRNILVAHCFVGGAQLVESDRAAVVGGSSQVALACFAGFDYVALGHLHRPQTVAPGVRYAGSPFPYSFSEAGQEKSFTLLDTADLSLRELPVETPRQLRVITGTAQEVEAGAPADQRPEDYLKIQLTDCPAGLERTQLLRQYYPNLLTLVGREPEGGETAGITVEELARLSPQELMERFCREVLDQEPDGELTTWFLEAAAQAEEEGELQ